MRGRWTDEGLNISGDARVRVVLRRGHLVALFFVAIVAVSVSYWLVTALAQLLWRV